MNISSEIFPADGLNSSDYFFFNATEDKIGFEMYSLVDIIIVLLGLPTNSYVIWLIVTGSGNGLAAEFFSLNLAVCEMIFCMECLFNLTMYEMKGFWIALDIFYSLALTGRPLFQCLICVERYLAVVHPVTFLKFKPLKYRVICCVIAWVVGFGSSGIMFMTLILTQFQFYCIFIMAHFFLFLFIQLFFLVAVLRALKQSGPGERRREREEGNHMKKRAFYIILITSVTMLIIFLIYMILLTLSLSEGEIFMGFAFVCFVFTGLVQPVLFLHRVGKCPFIKCK